MNVTILVIFFFEQSFHKFFHFKWTLSYTSSLTNFSLIVYFHMDSQSRILLVFGSEVLLHLLVCSPDSLLWVSILIIFFLRRNFSQVVYFHMDSRSQILPWLALVSVAHLYFLYLICECDKTCNFFLRTNFSHFFQF